MEEEKKIQVADFDCGYCGYSFKTQIGRGMIRCDHCKNFLKKTDAKNVRDGFLSNIKRKWGISEK